MNLIYSHNDIFIPVKSVVCVEREDDKVLIHLIDGQYRTFQTTTNKAAEIAIERLRFLLSSDEHHKRNIHISEKGNVSVDEI